MICIRLSKELRQKLGSQTNIRVHLTKYGIYWTKQMLKSKVESRTNIRVHIAKYDIYETTNACLSLGNRTNV